MIELSGAVYVLVIMLTMVTPAPEASDPSPTVLSTEFDSRYDCEEAEGEAVTGAYKNPSVNGIWVDPHSCEQVFVPKKS